MDFLKRDKNIWLGAAELFDLPPDLVAGLPHMEMLGDRYFYMERHKGILSYSGEEIDINGETGIVRIFGRDLELTSMTGDQLRIQGSISRLEWVK
ncbi:MAG: sporulation protein [Oscillospiraceae bacterium]|jgi:sporulation protein YqfC|nr:sporulation protein [Oscillospiraceae bacterium]MCI8720920.1 sporulation protein [Oscillospiraceae bacterium]MCI8943504.1 sporulation protein [Oscillospiraceae bacterium]MDE6933807.1 sporulation protein [Oscillospiraceae bacterium]